MTKAPRVGQVKTRLTPLLTPEEAAALHVCFLRDTASALAATVALGGARGVVVYTPAGAEEEVAGILPTHFELILQRGGTLEERLIAAAEDLFRAGFSSLCFINSDSPTVPASVYEEAVRVLSGSETRLVLGPADDGGYYLIGFNRLERRLFEEIDWSTERVFEQTLQRAKEIGIAAHLLPRWYDVDDPATLRRLCEELLSGPTEGHPAPATRAFLQQLIQRGGRERIG